MELITMLVEIFPTVGFPIICVGVMGWFIYKFYNDSQKANAEREEKLYIQLGKQNEINERFAEIIAKYDVKLDEIRDDVAVIKMDVEVLKNK